MRLRCLSPLSGVCAVVFAAAAASGQTTISQLSDPENPSMEAGVDIVSAAVIQDHGRLTFRIETRGPIPTALPDPDDFITFLWLLDTDRNSATGQPHGALGSEFNVRAVIGETYGGGFVDVTGGVPGGGGGSVEVQGNRVEITIWLYQIGSAAGFNWRCDSFHIVDGGWVSGNYETAIASADTLAFTPAARVIVTPPLLMLSPSGPTTGQVQVEVRDANGNVQPTGNYHVTFESTYEPVATVDVTGVVTAHMPPAQHWRTPYIVVRADGLMADNAAVVRVTANDLGVVHQMFWGTNVAYYLVPMIEGVDLAGLTSAYEVVTVTDRAYLDEAAGFGTTYLNGARLFLVLDVTDDPVTAVCGASGSPIRLGWLYGQPAHNSCYIINDPAHRTPQWFVIFHEMGHDIASQCNAFNLFCMGPSQSHDAAYSEGTASLAALWAWQSIMRCPRGIGSVAIADFDEHIRGYMSVWRQSLVDYQSAGASYALLDANVLDGILCVLFDQYGPKIWFDYLSSFLPAQAPLPVPIDTLEKQATWFVAAVSASTGEDLRDLFETAYGFPVDESAWPEIFAAVSARVAARSIPAPTAGDSNCDCVVDVNDVPAFVMALINPAGYAASYPDCDRMISDVNRDDRIDGRDIQAFVLTLVDR